MRRHTTLLSALMLVFLLGGAGWQWTCKARCDQQLRATRQEAARSQRFTPTGGESEKESRPREVAAAADETLSPEQNAKKQARLQVSLKLSDPQNASLYRHLKLSPDRLRAFKALLAEREWDRMTALAEGRKYGLTDTSNRESRAIQDCAVEESNQAIRALLGEEDYAYFLRYDESSSLRNLFRSETDYLKATGEPLNDGQMDEFIFLAYAHMKEGLLSWREGGGPEVSEEMERKAAGFMNARQLAWLRSVRQTLDAQHQLDQLNRAAAQQGKLTLRKSSAKDYPLCPILEETD